MKTLFQHIERVQGQPHHIRRQIAFASAATITALIALVWFVGSLSLGAFSITGGSFAAGGAQGDDAAAAAADQNLAGAGAASFLQSADESARIEIIDASPAPSAEKQIEQTIIPF